MRVVLVQDSTGHSTGYYVVARALREAGFEVILGGVLLPAGIVRLAADEGADAIGYRIMDGSPVILVGRLREEMTRQGVGDIPIAVGGIVPDEELPRLRALGVAAVFRPGATFDEIARGLGALARPPSSGRP
ncbi:MAG: cobalamin B12-binding domain-containing protein [Deltaproteobacteria bacterium]|nr:cobalamin B12-binding domain-containing protein [Deltaproteobacteria bacterium]